MTRSHVARYVHITAMFTLGALAVFHLMIAPAMFDELSGRLIWYIATDFGVMCLIFLNFVVRYVPPSESLPWLLCHTANGSGVALGVINLIAVPEPINIAVLAAYAALAVGAYRPQDVVVSHPR
jgi:hypothetical protein